MPISFSILLAFGLDLLIGDPSWLPHPVRAIGLMAQGCETLWRRLQPWPRLAGVLTVVSVLAGVGGAVVGLLSLAGWFHPWARDLMTIYLLYASFAARDLARHSRRVRDALVAGDLNLARQQLAMIVGRETANLEAEAISRAAVESVAENIVDGVTAPLMWAAVAGPLGALLYKAVNTMDSMFGYKNERYLLFGWAPARLDDLANYLPARLTAVLVVLAAGLLGHSPLGSFRIWRRDRRCHSSPNSAQTEAAVAGALGIQLGGAAVYFGVKVDKPTIGDADQQVIPSHILAANRLMLVTAGLAAGLGALIRFAVGG
jgi:adenosylcobinamide-phosphate synthase